MFHSIVKCGLSLAILTGLTAMNASTAAGQDAPKKPSLWQQMKDAAKQAQQQGHPQQQPGLTPGQQQQGQQQHPGQVQRGGQINDSGPFKPPAGTKIEEKILAPVQQGARFTVSPHGVHVATISNSGSRAVVIYDGVEGPRFDEILNSREIAFSPDGNRYAYCARSGDQYVVMVDGKELVRSPESRDGSFDDTTCKLGFTSNSKHVYYYSNVSSSTPPASFERFVFDGKPGIPSSDSNNLLVSFSPDGDHYAYVWNDPQKQRPWTLIVDGKPAGYQGGDPQWTADSKHLYTQNRQGQATDLMFDGKPIARAFNFRVSIPPVGDMVVVAASGGSLVKAVEFLVVGGKKVPASEIPHDRGGVERVVFSPDGKHYAAVYTTTKNTRYVFTDGKPGEEYVIIDQLAFTADSSKLVYRAIVNGKTFIVAGDQEFEGNTIAQVMSPVGNRVGSLLLGNGGSPSLLMDGKVTKLNIAGGDDLSFSPDGGHYAYFAVDASLGHRLVLDGIVQSESVLTKVDTMDLQNALALKYVFSPDGQHIAHFAGPPTPTGGYDRGIFLDGKYIPASAQGTNHKLSFSPDSKHLFWIHGYGNQPYRIFIDGKPLMEFSPAGMVPNWWEFGPDGTLSFLAQDDNSLKRITITPSPETSIATMLR
jgi:Tol biopolymer transport system component